MSLMQLRGLRPGGRGSEAGESRQGQTAPRLEINHPPIVLHNIFLTFYFQAYTVLSFLKLFGHMAL